MIGYFVFDILNFSVNYRTYVGKSATWHRDLTIFNWNILIFAHLKIRLLMHFFMSEEQQTARKSSEQGLRLVMSSRLILSDLGGRNCRVLWGTMRSAASPC